MKIKLLIHYASFKRSLLFELRSSIKMYTLDKTIDIFTLYLSLSIVIGQNDKDNDTVWWILKLIMP